MRRYKRLNPDEYISTSWDTDHFTTDELKSFLIYLQKKYRYFGEKGHQQNRFESQYFDPLLSTFLGGWIEEIEIVLGRRKNFNVDKLEEEN